MKQVIKRSEGRIGGEMKVVVDIVIDVADLQGSEKQITWANTIRHKWFNEYLVGAILACGRDNAQANLTKAIEVNPVVISRINQTSAKWWIDNRDNQKAK